MAIKARVGKTYSEYQVEKIISNIEKDYEQQWQERVKEIQDKTFEQVKVDMWSQMMSIAMATLEKFHNFTEDDCATFYNNCIQLMSMMNSKPLGKDFTTEDTISHVKESTGIDLDKDFRNLSEKETEIYDNWLDTEAKDTGITL